MSRSTSMRHEVKQIRSHAFSAHEKHDCAGSVGAPTNAYMGAEHHQTTIRRTNHKKFQCRGLWVIDSFCLPRNNRHTEVHTHALA